MGERTELGFNGPAPVKRAVPASRFEFLQALGSQPSSDVGIGRGEPLAPRHQWFKLAADFEVVPTVEVGPSDITLVPPVDA
jgi:hypothetical protein